MQRVSVTTPLLSTVLGTLCCVLGACDVYDADLISNKPPQPLGSQPRDAGMIEPEPRDADAPDATDALPTPPVTIDTNTTNCGDGRVSGGEKCDTGIPGGTPGACPTQCPDLSPCNPRALNNSGCQAECVLLDKGCRNDDDCCPGECTTQTDNDCSTGCPDGKVQAEDGETCDPESDTPCKQNDADCNDNNPCTTDKLVGSAMNCNSACTNTLITEAKGGDTCCPSGADANSDMDCTPKCGNGVRESGEECDGSEGCDASCKLPVPPMDQMRCLDMFGGENDACARCACMNCTSTYLACRTGGDAAASKQCNDVLTCAEQKDCYGSACYCGDSFLCAAPNGECRMEIELATGSPDPLVINARSNDLRYPVGRAYAADTCRVAQCARECRPMAASAR
jgi:hypothetical protein